MEFNTSLSLAKDLDTKDELKDYRQRFHFPTDENGKELIYFCGNSLGLQAKTVKNYIQQELDDWAKYAVEGHFEAKYPWVSYHELLTESTAKLVGALPEEVVVMNSLTANLHLMLASFYQPTVNRYKILMEKDAFCSDHYAIKSHLEHRGFNVKDAIIEVEPRDSKHITMEDDIFQQLEFHGDEIALVLLGGVNYYTGQLFDMEKITSLAQKKGCVVGWDLAHAVGNVPLKLHEWGVDFAVWCSYKYLNAGPGAVGGCFIGEEHLDDDEIPRLAGWWGHDKKTRFEMPRTFKPMHTAEGWQLSNAPVLSMASLRASMEIFDEVGMKKLRKKSELMTSYLEFLIESIPNSNLNIITPKEKQYRGAQLSIIANENGKEIYNHLKQNGIICDWREPNVIRIAPAPLYVSFEDVWHFYDEVSNYFAEKK